MSDDPVLVFWSWGQWLFGAYVNGSGIEFCFGPLTVSIIPSRFKKES